MFIQSHMHKGHTYICIDMCGLRVFQEENELERCLLHNGMACVGITVKPPSKQPDAMLALSKHEVVRAPELKDIAGKRMWQATVEIIGSFKQTCH